MFDVVVVDDAAPSLDPYIVSSTWDVPPPVVDVDGRRSQSPPCVCVSSYIHMHMFNHHALHMHILYATCLSSAIGPTTLPQGAAEVYSTSPLGVTPLLPMTDC